MITKQQFLAACDRHRPSTALEWLFGLYNSKGFDVTVALLAETLFMIGFVFAVAGAISLAGLFAILFFRSL